MVDKKVNKKYDIIVCGAGPVGLFFAYQMIMQGHSVYICDQKEGPTEQSRAFFVSARSLEVFENKGIAHHLLHEAYVLRGVQLFIEGCESASLESDDVGETIFPQLTSIPQSKTESILASLIQEKTTIEWNTKLVSYTEQNQLVTAIVTKDNGKTTECIQGKYIIGADGAHSTVRNGDPTWTYDGESSETKFALADVVLSGPDLDIIKDKFNVFYHSEGMCLLIPINFDHHNRKNNLFRMIANKGPYEKRPSTKNVTHGINGTETLSLDEVNQILKTRLEKLNLVASDPAWLTHFYINERKANGFRRGRAFLIGDAAHCHSPVGGQGMNLGLQDADNLAWKMSLVLKGLSSDPELLLDSYTIEREPIAENTISQTGNATELAMSVSFFMAILRYFISSSNFCVSKLKEYGMASILQLHTSIDNSSRIIGASDPSLIKAGKFLPESTLLLKRCLAMDQPEHLLERKTLHQIISNTGNHTALWIATRPASYSASCLTSKFWKKIQTNFGSSIRPLIIESTWNVPEYRLADDIMHDIKDLCDNDDKRIVIAEKLESENFWVEYLPTSSNDSITSLIGLHSSLVNTTHTNTEPPAALLIIRPDLYITSSTLVLSEDDINKALAFLHTYLK
ncbi:FAD binding domain-containing protein [Cokeromyces recurvatus]|uniref:FAD binding domain-containing protein n=1 Tax=Cokeromyces recurvatus TaxID=90255 RepID=UPI00221E3A08|nr:FAD binding domain-containing protein [Cokeromyces recurvatus]KAI7900681.1 FAD binding domain-containing protein [Cokeromyces recurvatus]